MRSNFGSALSGVCLAGLLSAAPGALAQQSPIYAERDLILVKGSVPGANGGLVIIRDAVKAGV